MGKPKIKQILLICLIVYFIFVAIVIVLFHYVQNNPIDKVSMTYIWHNTDIQNQYGEIVSVGRNVLLKRTKNGSTIKSPYIIETKTNRVKVYVTLIQTDKQLNAVSYEVIEVRPNES